MEDNLVNQKVAKALLEKLGCQVDVAANGLEGVRLSAELSYDLILMDCQMPEMDGFEATLAIRKRETGVVKTPIVALTAGAMADDRKRCAEAGMDGYLTKPIRLGLLETMLKEQLERGR